jgi:hypothetical protein
MGPTGCTETSVRNFHCSLRNNPEQHRSKLVICLTVRSSTVLFARTLKDQAYIEIVKGFWTMSSSERSVRTTTGRHQVRTSIMRGVLPPRSNGGSRQVCRAMKGFASKTNWISLKELPGLCSSNAVALGLSIAIVPSSDVINMNSRINPCRGVSSYSFHT